MHNFSYNFFLVFILTSGMLRLSDIYYNFTLRKTKMADFERRQFEIGLKFVCRSFAELNNFSEGSSKPKKDAQVIRVRGAAAPRVF